MSHNRRDIYIIAFAIMGFMASSTTLIALLYLRNGLSNISDSRKLASLILHGYLVSVAIFVFLFLLIICALWVSRRRSNDTINDKNC